MTKSYYSTAKRKINNEFIKTEKGKIYAEIPEEICKIFQKQGWLINYYLDLAFDVDEKGNITLRHEF